MMELVYAKELLSILADGIDPYSGEILPENHICNRPEIIRALHAVLNAVPQAGEMNKPEPRPDKALHPQMENAGKPWTPEDEQALIRMFDRGCSRKDIRACLRRSDGAIAARLVHLGKIRERDEYRNLPR